MKSYIIFIILLFHQASYSAGENENSTSSFLYRSDSQNSLLPASVGEYCLDRSCSENQFCNDLFICQCFHGFKSFNGICIPCAGENEKCMTSADCCGMLVCIYGVCRRPRPIIEFSSVAKVCVAITATIVMIGLFSCFLKLMVRYLGFRGQNNTSNSNSVEPQSQQIHDNRPFSYEIEEKPPSYEECIRTSPKSPFLVPPPPYIVSTNTSLPFASNNTTQPTNVTPSNQQNLTSLNVLSLKSPIISDTSLKQVEDLKSTDGVSRSQQ